MTVWEYKIVHIDDLDGINNRLATLGQGEWELVSVSHLGIGYDLWFKRPFDKDRPQPPPLFDDDPFLKPRRT